ncbi:HlyU family transcriptional regulator [Nitratireductor aquimarinus]|uniref:HlyU family transcriptional regulator n=1 Tax=Nitratireductor aquimarinus TaxID=889300 RepID=A0ABU4AFT1_9HYPH|nr:HlyU family transcriptional regulator [Nitratireductor aquimarinus]MDV6225094.1 HlyU family transcriptional regulator [Nitratireductor aquimarinus]
MSFLKRLFGGGGSTPETGEAKPVGDAVEHKGFTIQPTPFPEGGQFQTCALITKDVDGERKEHRLVRADRFPSAEFAADQSIRKARQMIDEQGEKIFT